MGMPLPPVSDPDHFRAELSLIPARDREDAIQEAWVAHLEGRDPIQAAKTYAKREHVFRGRHNQIETDEDGEPFAVDKDGSRTALPASQQTDSATTGTTRRDALAKAG